MSMNDEMTKPAHEDDRSDAVTPEPVDESVEVAEEADAPLADDVLIELAEDADGRVGDALRQVLVERDQAREDRLRALAEVRNNQRRAVENERRIERASRAGAYRGVLPVLDQLDMALSQELETISIDQLAEGVRIARDEMAKTLADQGVDRIYPEVGSPFDPVRHEAMLRQEAEGIESDHIVMVMQPGYAMGDQVLRPAKVAVAP
ncbi:MAG: nucleotide exchange factor GrpE [Phycisphaerales bacterium]|nr:nucleotide exchange factor GrpE [Phycisphaerales bacterium]